MPSILAIFLLVGTFTQHALGNGPGSLTFTIDVSKLADKSPELVKVEIRGKKCAEPTIVPPSLNKSKQLTVSWKDCPEVNGAADLKDVWFHIQLLIAYGQNQNRRILDVIAGLEKNTDDELKQFFAGGKATIIISANGKDYEVKYVEDRNTSASHGNPAPLTFTIDSKLVLYEGQLDAVEIWQNGQKCGKPTSLNGSTQFTVDWTECSEEVKKAADFKHIEITIQYLFGPPHERMIQRVGAQLGECSDDLSQKLFVGGKAKILVSENGRNNVIELADKNGHPRILTFTVDSHYMLNGSKAKLKNAQIFQNYEKCKATIVSPNLNESKQFTIDWEDCPKKLNEFTNLDDIQINVYLGHGKQEMVLRFYLKEYSDGLLRHLFAGGEAEISIRNGNEGKTLKEIRYVRHPNQILFAAPGLLTFNVEYESRTIVSLSEVTLEHTSKEMGGCKPAKIKVKDAQFSVDLPKCNVHDIEDLLGLDIHIKLLLQNPDNPNRSQPKRLLVPLAILKEGEKPEDVQKEKDVQQQFYNGGHAKIVFNNKDEPSLIHIRPNYAEPSSISRMEGNFLTQHLSASAKEFQKLHPGASSSHSSSKSAGTVKFTIHPKKLPQQDAQLESVHIYQNDDDEKVYKVAITKESKQFTVDWNDCPEKPKTATDLKEIEILVTFAGRRKLHYQFNLNEEEKYSEDLLKNLFDGGEAKLVISDNGSTKHTDIEFMKDSNANRKAEASGEEQPPFKRRKLMKIEAAQPALLAFNVDYENREGAFFDEVKVHTYLMDVEDAVNCKPLLYEGGKKFSVNLANCGVKTAKDLPELMFEIHFLLDYAPGKEQDVKRVTRLASLFGQPDEELQKFFNGGEAKLVFFDPDQQKQNEFVKYRGRKIGMKNPFFALTHLSAPNKPSSHEKSKRMGGIQLFVEDKIFQAKNMVKPYYIEGRDVWGYEELKAVDEQNMKLRKHGVECPVRVWDNSGGQVAKFLIHWAECEPFVTSSKELDGMLLNLIYQQGKWAKELFYTFTANDPLKQIFDGHLEFRLVEYEPGKVKHEQSQGPLY